MTVVTKALLRNVLFAAAALLIAIGLVPSAAQAEGGSRSCICTQEGQTVGGCTYPFFFCCDFDPGLGQCGCVLWGWAGTCGNQT
jgi:hypothetical protein